MQLVTDYLHQEYKDGNIIGGRLICSVCRVSENPTINPFADYRFFFRDLFNVVFPPKTEQDASNRLSSSNSDYSQIVRFAPSLSIVCRASGSAKWVSRSTSSTTSRTTRCSASLRTISIPFCSPASARTPTAG